jgi:hypothetical protein
LGISDITESRLARVLPHFSGIGAHFLHLCLLEISNCMRTWSLFLLFRIALCALQVLARRGARSLQIASHTCAVRTTSRNISTLLSATRSANALEAFQRSSRQLEKLLLSQVVGTGDAGVVLEWGFTFLAGASTDWNILTFSEFLPSTPIGTFGDYNRIVPELL